MSIYTVNVQFSDEEMVVLRRLSEQNGTSHGETVRMAVLGVERLRDGRNSEPTAIYKEDDGQDNAAEHPASIACYESFLTQTDSVDKTVRVEAINDLIHRLKFERRWSSLVPNQLQHMADESLSGAERKALAACKTESERDERFDMYARARYFRRCAWIMYLNGEEEKPPVEPEPNELR